jgi:hypothetical protein
MCKNFIEIKDGKISKIKGIFKHGAWVVCMDCKNIAKIHRTRKHVLWLRSWKND